VKTITCTSRDPGIIERRMLEAVDTASEQRADEHEDHELVPRAPLDIALDG
jgi:hypothetical protein